MKNRKMRNLERREALTIKRENSKKRVRLGLILWWRRISTGERFSYYAPYIIALILATLFSAVVLYMLMKYAVYLTGVI